MIESIAAVYRNSRPVVRRRLTGELAGLDGGMRIIVASGAHSYEFDYSIDSPATP